MGVAVAPNKAGECAKVEIQEYYRGAWHPNVTTNCVALNKNSVVGVYFTLNQADIGYHYRLRGDYVRGSDLSNLALIGPGAGQTIAVGQAGENAAGIVSRQTGTYQVLSQMLRHDPAAHVSYAVGDDMTGTPVPAAALSRPSSPPGCCGGRPFRCPSWPCGGCSRAG